MYSLCILDFINVPLALFFLSTAQIINEGEDIKKGDYFEYNQDSPVYGITNQITNNTKKSVSYARCIENWSQFIEGNGNLLKNN